MIKKETILSNYDNKLTLLQWLKQVQGQLKDLKENGVPANTPVYSAKEFDEKYKNANGEYVNCIFVIDGPYTETIYLNGQLYAGDNVPAWAGNYQNYFIFGTYGDYIYWKEDGFGEGSVHNCYSWTFNDTFTEMLDEDDYSSGGKFFMKPDVDNAIDEKIRTDVYDYTNWGGLYKELLDRSNLHKFVYQQKKTCYGICGVNLARDMAIGMFKYNANIHVYNFNGILIKNNGEIFYSNGEGQLDSTSGVLSNAVSGTELKEAVRLANQKTYWHSVKIKGANGIFTLNAPSKSNTEVVSTEQLLQLFNNNVWAGFGQLGTDMLFAIRLHSDSIEFIKVDDTSVSLGAFGTFEIRDDVKEVK